MGNRKKRLLALILSFVLAFGMVTPGFAADGWESGTLPLPYTSSDFPQIEMQTTSPAALGGLIEPFNIPLPADFNIYLDNDGVFRRGAGGGQDITTDINAMGATFDTATQTLTLNNFEFRTIAVEVIRVPIGTTIELIGTNSLVSEHATPGNGIFVPINGSITISGDGILNVHSIEIPGTGSIGITGGIINVTHSVIPVPSIADNATVTLTNAPPRTITFNANTGAVDPASGTTGINGRLTTILPTPTRVGYDFDGWFTVAIGGTPITAETVFFANTTIFAQWTAIQFHAITVNGGTANPNPATVGQTITLTAGTPPTGQQFVNWTSTQVTITNPTQASGATFVMLDNTVTVTANFEPIPPTPHAITVNGGTANPNPATVGQTVTLTVGTPPTGQQFVNWTSTQVTITNPTQASGATFVMLDNTVTVTANFEPIPPTPHAITVNGGTASPNPATVGQTITLTAGTPPTGQQFVNWTSSQVTITNPTQASGATFVMSDNAVTVTANFEPIPPDTHTVTFNTHNGTPQPPAQNIPTGQPATRPPTNPTRTGYNFVNWYTAATGGTPFSFSIPITADTVIHARWTPAPPATWTVTFNLNGGNIIGNTANVVMPNITHGASVTPPNPSRQNHNFTSWSSNVTGMTPANITGNVVFTAGWQYTGTSSTGNGGNDHDWRTHARTPSITTQPQNVTVYADEQSTLSVTATASDSGTLSFQWQRATGASGGAFRDIPNATDRIFHPDTNTAGINRYRVVITNTNNSGYVTGNRTSRTTSRTVTVTINEPTLPPSDPPPGQYPTPDPTPTPDTTPPAYIPWINPFTDVHESDWFFNSVRFVHQNNLFSGTTATTFSPNTTMTRGMMVTVLHRMAGRPDTSDLPNIFTDVPGGAWYDDAIRWAAANGIVSGIGNQQFAPNNPITREQMAAILTRYAAHMGIELVPTRTGAFNDAEEISGWAMQSVNVMYEAGIISGRGNGIFDPQGNATRAEVATLLQNFMEITDTANSTTQAAASDIVMALREEEAEDSTVA